MQMNEDKPLFRVGGVYREETGFVVRLEASDRAGVAVALVLQKIVEDEGPLSCYIRDGHRRLIDGTDMRCPGTDFDLIPGELELRDGQWVPVEEKEEAKPGNSVWLLGPLEPIGDDYDEGDADAAMIARDGPDKPAAVVIEQPASTAKPALPALSIATDLQPASHQVRAVFGSAELVR